MANTAESPSELLPLTVDTQAKITPRQLAKVIMRLLRRNGNLTPAEREYKLSYYPFALQAIRDFEIVGHANPEVANFRYKWNEAIAILKSKALIMFDPAQGDVEYAMVPTSYGYECDLDQELGS